MRCPECGADGPVLGPPGPVCNRCLGSGRLHVNAGPIGELGRFLKLSRRLREQKTSSESMSIKLIVRSQTATASDQADPPRPAQSATGT